MVLFGRAYELRATPLSSAVPLEGTDTIPGLRILEQTVPASFQRNCFERVRRYRGPYLQQLTTDHLKAEPKPWRTFFEGTEGWSGSYCIPSDWFSLTDRAEENVVLFLVRLFSTLSEAARHLAHRRHTLLYHRSSGPRN
uniref:Uncharacterized protein n=1 Tax=Tetraselmis sp. GSL018 TaxID=582737 RepID=A0A061SNT6_9CHLO